jgi:serine/threonine protein kinase
VASSGIVSAPVVSTHPLESAGSDDGTTPVSGTPSPTSQNRERAATADSRFHIIGEVGEGGMALVHLALARGPNGFDKLVVLKTLRSNLASDPECVDMFQHEARLAARLDHPNVVRTYEVSEENGRTAIVMEYLEGQPLSQVIARAKGAKGAHGASRLPLAMHVRAICDALAGLHYAHELADFDGTPLGLIHRDVTPHNVFITFDGQVKLLDFGIAKVQTNASAQTEFGVLKGKVLYMAPEQLTGDRIDRRADLYAVGAMLWEALAGERIWLGMPDFVAMQHVVEGKIPSPRTRNPRVPAILEAICVKAMAHRPANRYATAEEFRLALEAAADVANAADAADTNAASRANARLGQRDLGRFVADLFAETRTQIQATIDEQMARHASLPPNGAARIEPVALPHWEIASPRARGRLGDPPADEAREGASRASRPGWILLAAIAVAAAVLVLAAWAWLAVHPSLR